jgi:hypothetical protein
MIGLSGVSGSSATILLLLTSFLLELHIAAFASLGIFSDSPLQEIFLRANSKDKLLLAIDAEKNLILKMLLLHTSPHPGISLV